MQSQAAYKLAVQGLIRPADKNIPMIYIVKCIDFTPPEFTLGKYLIITLMYCNNLTSDMYILFSEIVCLNENDMYLKTIVHDLGMQLRSVATCTEIQCFRYALFDLNIALLKKHWGLQNILDNTQICDNILKDNRYLLRQDRSILVDPSDD